MKADRDASENVRDLLSELTRNEADTVRPLLLSLQSMADGDVPPPSPELAALLEANGSPAPAPRRIRHRGAVFSLALIGALAAGAGTATAVSPEFRTGTAHVITGIINAIPFGRAPIPHSVPSAPPASTHTPGPPTKFGGSSNPTRSPGTPAQSNGNGKSSSGHSNPKATTHPTPPANSHGRAP